jgi:hypothetical protein
MSIAPISASGASSASFQQQNLSVLRAQIKQLSGSIKNYGLDEKTTQSFQKAITSLDAFTSASSPKDLTVASKNLMIAFDNLNFDLEFVMDQIEEMQNSKGKKKNTALKIAEIQQSSMIHLTSSTTKSIQQTSSFSSQCDCDSSQNLEELERKAEDGDLGAALALAMMYKSNQQTGTITPDLIKDAEEGNLGAITAISTVIQSQASSQSIQLDAKLVSSAEEGNLGAITAMSIAIYQQSTTVTEISASKLTIEGSLISTIGTFTSEELEEMIKAIIMNGFRDINEIMALLSLIGEHGGGIEPALLDTLAEKIVEFINSEAANTTDPLEFMAFLDTLSTFMSTEIGTDMFSSLNLEGPLTSMISGQSLDESSANAINAMANSLGISNIAVPEENSALDLETNPETLDNNDTLVAASASAEFELNRRISPLDKPSTSKAPDKEKHSLQKVAETMKSFLNHKKSDLISQSLTLMEKFLEKQLDSNINHTLDNIDLPDTSALEAG